MHDLNDTLEGLRQNYQKAHLDITDCHENPEIQFDHWMENAIKSKCDEPNAFVLSTVGEDGFPRGRVLLLKGIHDGQFVFFTNYKSEKGHEIEKNPKVSLTFLWLPLQRQVRIEGTAVKVSEHASDEYFHKRPRGSQLGAIASPQSIEVASRKFLEDLFLEVEVTHKGIEALPRPKDWGGYGVIPEYFEFWQGRPNRLHDRIRYVKSAQGWKKSRLAP